MNELQGTSISNYEKPDKLVFFLHGYGSNAEDMISLSTFWNFNIKINFFAPNAPFNHPEHFNGYQWFDIYPNGVPYNMAGEKENKIMENECKISTKKIESYILNLCKIHSVNLQDCFIIGFSQGAMIAYELGLYIKKKLAGCIMISGRVLSDKSIEKNTFTKTPLMILHGDKDDIITPNYFVEATKIAKSNGFEVEDHLIVGEGHAISQNMLKLIQNFVEKNV
tara:strand:+ start:1505 stop:2173 length:669 start_codon:yes stop_codon:yes gene_type:complete